MRIYSMTATFGKLSHETLTLKPGLNVITGANEWGKSTWCAFLTAMLYGLDTRAKSTKTALADKERYAPWSGLPMSGRMELNWQGRDITIERSTRGRVPLGEFRAYETASGTPIPELDGRNCGEMLLGVERSVFLRSAFLRSSDLNVTQDDALRRRLNNLVTTGDETGAADGMARQLRDLKNKVRYNHTGLLPQAEGERDRLEATLKEMERLEQRNDEILRRMDELEDWRMALENHRDALAYQDSLEDARKVAAAEEICRECREKYRQLRALCETLADRETAREKLEAVRNLEDRQLALHRQIQALGEPEDANAFDDLTPEDARNRARTDAGHYERLSGKHFLGIFSLLVILGGLVWLYFQMVPGAVCCAVGLILGLWALVRKLSRRREMAALEDLYGPDDPQYWPELAEGLALDARLRRELEARQEALKAEIRELTEGQGLELYRRDWEKVLSAWEARDEALQDMDRAESHCRDLRAMARQAKEPEFPDRLTHTETYTVRLIEECLSERQRLENRQGQCRGSMEALGDKRELLDRLDAVRARITGLEKTFAALTVAQETLAQAASELQRRFAPRISRRAGEIMHRLTDGRYDRLSIGEDLSLRAGTAQEDTLRDTLWRSEGTADQLYLALRLAVAEELLPGGPLVLDDAFVRFDDKRLAAAMELLKEMAHSRQVILFTCHEREGKML